MLSPRIFLMGDGAYYMRNAYNGRVKKAFPPGKRKRDSAQPTRTGRAAIFVASGILVSRLVGLVRARVFAHYFGLSDEGDVFMQGFRIPNFLQNLFGEGALSASFIPVYASLLERDRREADRVAGAVASILALVISILVLLGVLITPVFIDLIAPGFEGAKRDLTIRVARILFPGAGLLVLSSWCLGVLNSHRRFLLSYMAPVIWNVAMIAALLVFGSSNLSYLAIMLAWGSVVGSALQFVIQLPIVIRVAPQLKFALYRASEDVRSVVRNFLPAFISRGVVQISAYIDSIIVSYLPTGAVTGLTNAQLLYTLPVSLFGMSVSAAELPTMSSAAAAATDATGQEAVRQRLNGGLRQIAFFVVPSSMAFLAFGDVIAAVLLEGGRFHHSDSLYVWGILAGSAVGLVASTLGRLYAYSYYALRDTRTPLRYALIRLSLTAGLGYIFALPLPRLLQLSQLWGAAGLTASAGIAGWFEMLLLRRTLNARIGHTGLPFNYVVKLWCSSAAGAVAGWATKLILPPMASLRHSSDRILIGIVILGIYGIVFLGCTLLMRIPEASTAVSRIRQRL
jgi:putative peptidoglycan lipid II flippase